MALSIATDLTGLLVLAAAEGFALTGGFPETYLAARPFPGADAGSLLARTVESLGMISVSSVYSAKLSVNLENGRGKNPPYLHYCSLCRS
jgi:hypothetical protein